MTNLPRIVQVYASSTYQTAICGDSVYLYVEFDQAVEVYDKDSDDLRIYLNTQSTQNSWMAMEQVLCASYTTLSTT